MTLLFELKNKYTLNEYLETESKQMPKLKAFYDEALLPELACPRYGTVGIIREPQPSHKH